MANSKRTTTQPKKQDSANKSQNSKKKRRPRKHFLAVDVWQKEFGPVSVRAVYDIFQQRKGIETRNLKNYSFSDCVNFLRSLEEPDYIPPQDQCR